MLFDSKFLKWTISLKVNSRIENGRSSIKLDLFKLVHLKSPHSFKWPPTFNQELSFLNYFELYFTDPPLSWPPFSILGKFIWNVLFSILFLTSSSYFVFHIPFSVSIWSISSLNFVVVCFKLITCFSSEFLSPNWSWNFVFQLSHSNLNLSVRDFCSISWSRIDEIVSRSP